MKETQMQQWFRRGADRLHAASPVQARQNGPAPRTDAGEITEPHAKAAAIEALLNRVNG
jgi:hypothetical protein